MFVSTSPAPTPSTGPFSNRPGGSGGAGGELQSARGKDHKDIGKDNSLPPSFPMYQSEQILPEILCEDGWRFNFLLQPFPPLV